MYTRTIKFILDTASLVLRSLDRRQLLGLGVALLLMLIAGCLTNIPTVVIGSLVDSMFRGDIRVFSAAIPYLLLISAAIILREIIKIGHKYIVESTCTQLEKKSLVKLVDHILQLRVDFYTGVQVGSLNGRIHRSIEGLVRLVKLIFLEFTPSSIAAIVAITIAFVKLPLLGCIMALAIPTTLAIVFRQIQSQAGIRIGLLLNKEKIDGKVVELLSGIETVRSQNTEKYEIQKVGDLAEQLRAKELQHHWEMSLYDCLKYLNEGMFHIMIMGLSIYFASQQVISVGDILTYSLLFINAMAPLREIHRILDELHENSLRVQIYDELLNIPKDESYFPEMKVANIKSTISQAIAGEDKIAISIQGVSYGYKNHSQDEDYVLKNINLKIKTGEVIGIAGASGCGKSSLLKLVLGFDYANEGMIKIYNEDIRNYDRTQISSLIGYVPQFPFMFSGTIEENVLYGSDSHDNQCVIEACKQACIHDEIMQMKNGYKTIVAERGQSLSGGQRQRLALARMLLLGRKIILLDEATSALDNISENTVLNNINSLTDGHTLIIVAHRLTTLRRTDRIFVFENGRIVEEGNYDTLQNSNGPFSRLKNATTDVLTKR